MYPEGLSISSGTCFITMNKIRPSSPLTDAFIDSGQRVGNPADHIFYGSGSQRNVENAAEYFVCAVNTYRTYGI